MLGRGQIGSARVKMSNLRGPILGSTEPERGSFKIHWVSKCQVFILGGGAQSTRGPFLGKFYPVTRALAAPLKDCQPQ